MARTALRFRFGAAFGMLAAAGLATTLMTASISAQVGRMPEGFTPIFNGRDLAGWHPSRTTHHGTTPLCIVENGVLIMKQNPFGQGGLLVTDKTYKDFELYLEANPDADFNSGIFLRSTESGSGYQVELVWPGNAGALIGERMRVSKPEYIGPVTDVTTVWKEGQFNTFRIRMVGEAPRVTLWINDTKMWELQMPKNDQIAGVYGGQIGLQLHWTTTYSDASGSGGSSRPWLVQRFRNIAIKELK
jgi:hypothetical protein